MLIEEETVTNRGLLSFTQAEFLIHKRKVQEHEANLSVCIFALSQSMDGWECAILPLELVHKNLIFT